MTASVSFLGDNLGDSLGDVLGDFSPVTTLLTWADGTFANASARYLNDETANVLYGQFAGGTAAIADIDGKNRYQSEGARTNLIPGLSGWTATGACTITSGKADPAGGSSAYEISGLSDLFTNQLRVIDGGGTPDDPLAISFFMRQVSATGTVRIAHRLTTTYGEWTLDLSLLSTSWENVTAEHPAITVVTPFKAFTGGEVDQGWTNASSTAVTFEMWQPQSMDATFPSSSQAGLTTKAADAMSFTSGDVPDAIRSGKWSTELTTMHDDTDLASAEVMYLYYLDASNYLSLTEDGAGNVQAKLATTSGNIVKTVTYSRDQTVTVTADFVAGELTTAGFTTGDGTTSGTVSDWPSSTLHIGSDSTPANHIFGRMSEPVPA